MPGTVGSHENWGNFKCRKWAELLRHSHHQPAEFLEPGPQLIGDVPPDLTRRLAVGLDEGLADGGGDNRLLRIASHPDTRSP